ncbi:hypothetical protein CDAR_175601 [Caerostris darwini]|uniref:Uncharacterized protein n=1 Tax=Caerostris darwini TaxID=1538125 RepID=A0AAV4VTW2_9ARAC|nr:hypothetical protein CDAR_175601 [Caerostris darwini]
MQTLMNATDFPVIKNKDFFDFIRPFETKTKSRCVYFSNKRASKYVAKEIRKPRSVCFSSEVIPPPPYKKDHASLETSSISDEILASKPHKTTT